MSAGIVPALIYYYSYMILNKTSTYAKYILI